VCVYVSEKTKMRMRQRAEKRENMDCFADIDSE
jgi:hypothetical protein